MQQDYLDINITRLLRAVLRNIWAILLAGLLGALMLFSTAMLLPKSYEAELLFYAGGNDAVDRCFILLESKTVLDEIAVSSGLPLSRMELQRNLKARPEGEIGFMAVTVRANDSDAAMALALAVEDVLPRYAGTIAEIGQLQVIDSAELVESKEASLILWVLAGALLGVFVSTALVLLMAQLDQRIRREEDLPLLLLATISKPDSSEDLRKLRSRLLHDFPQNGNGRILALLSAEKTVDSASLTEQLSLSFASLGKRVLLVEADMRNPKLARKKNLPYDGLAELLCGTEMELPYRSPEQETLRYLPAGDGTEQAAELLASDGMRQLLQQWRREFDWIILQLPSLEVCGDALGICAQTDAVILTVQLGRSKRDCLLAAEKELQSCGAKVPGAVLISETK